MAQITKQVIATYRMKLYYFVIFSGIIYLIDPTIMLYMIFTIHGLSRNLNIVLIFKDNFDCNLQL